MRASVKWRSGSALRSALPRKTKPWRGGEILGPRHGSHRTFVRLSAQRASMAAAVRLRPVGQARSLWSRMRSVLGRLLALHARGGTAGAVEEVDAGLLLGQVVPAVDHLVEVGAGRAARPAVDVGALVAVLEASGVVPAGFRVRIGGGLGDLVTQGAELDVAVGVPVGRLDL